MGEESGAVNTVRNTRRIMLIIACVVLLLAVITIIVVVVVLSNKPPYDMAVASDNAVCTDIGAGMLEKGGGAVDACIAILLCLGAVQPQSNGIGGGGFMLVHTKEDDKVINFREQAPAAATHEMFVADSDKAVNGGMASGIPGEISGYWTAHQMYGRLPWSELFTPSVEILRSGITVTAHMEKALESEKENLVADENIKAIFFTDGTDVESYLRKGDSYTNPALAAAYELIGKDGRDAFYKGSIAENIVAATSARDGILTMADLLDYETRVDDPFRFEYRGKKIITAPPPASGHVVALTLQLLNEFDISTRNTTAWNYVLEAFRFGYAMRSQTGDVKYSAKTTWVEEKISNGSWAREILRTNFQAEGGVLTPHIDINQYSSPIYENFDGTKTTHVSVLGPDGEAVSCTSTVNLYFGSRVMTDDGIVMNNEMDDFSTPGVENSFGYQPSPENFIVAGKRPLSSSSPSIVFDDAGHARFVTGAAGGSRIITGTLLSLINALDWGMTLAENMAAPRLHDQLGLETLYESDVDAALIQELGAIGYNMTLREDYMSVVTSVSSLGGKTEAQGDPRKEGTGKVVKS